MHETHEEESILSKNKQKKATKKHLICFDVIFSFSTPIIPVAVARVPVVPVVSRITAAIISPIVAAIVSRISTAAIAATVAAAKAQTDAESRADAQPNAQPRVETSTAAIVRAMIAAIMSTAIIWVGVNGALLQQQQQNDAHGDGSESHRRR